MPWKPTSHRSAEPQQRQSISRQKSQKLYGSNRWRTYSESFRKEHPLCESCQARGIVRPSQVVDHVIPHRGSETLFWDPSNHSAKCHPCHNKKSGTEAHV